MTEKQRRHPHVVNVSEVKPMVRETGTRFGGAMRTLGAAVAAKKIGCMLYEVPSGRAAFPYHYHCANEEAIYVLDGRGRLRIGDDEVDVGPGDYIAFPTGPDFAHQLTNTGDETLRYLCLSTKFETEVVGYPDSGKIGAIAIAPGKSFFDPPWVRAIFPADATVGYYEGEDVD